MTILTKPLRRQLETAIKQAREIAEDAAKEAIARMGVAEAEAPAHLSDDNKALRRRLRAHARTLGDTRDAAGAMSTTRLQDAASYEIWHRMLFGRFLAERGLLIHPELGAAMSVAELRDLAKEEDAADEWALAERYAAPGLPGVFKPEDPVLALPIAPEFSKRLRAVLGTLPDEVFIADDSLGWTYQFWRASEKDTVNAAGGKIGAAELPAVTQLFTEPYMVKFLLHNTLGAWWGGKVLANDPALARDAADEDELREACAIPGVTWDFLRFVRDEDSKERWRPGAGTFPGWPGRAAEITYCDPCCGSGHFLVEAFAILAALRQREEGLSAADAAVAVLTDNLHGLELDGRCVQIAAFNVALTAWKFVGNPISLPSPNIAWVGAPPPISRTEMAILSNGDLSLRRALEALYDQFEQAPILGSLLQVGARDLLDIDLREYGDIALSKLRSAEPERAESALAARGVLDAARLLSRQFTLLGTNVPFLGRGKQCEELREYISAYMPASRPDLATAMLERMFTLSDVGGTLATVCGQNWWYLNSYRQFRAKILCDKSLDMMVQLGDNCFQTPMFSFNVGLTIITSLPPSSKTTFSGIDVSCASGPFQKSTNLQVCELTRLDQSDQLKNPDERIALTKIKLGKRLGVYCNSWQGIKTSDDPSFIRKFWEIYTLNQKWTLHQTTTTSVNGEAGLEHILLFEGGCGRLREMNASQPRDRRRDLQGRGAWGKQGIAVNLIGDLHCSLYMGTSFDTNIAVLEPHSEDDLAAVAAYCASSEFINEVRALEPTLKANNGVFLKLPFDIDAWRDVGSKKFPGGLSPAHSDDPTQWGFHGHPAFSVSGAELHVALARVAGYRWPAESDTMMRLSSLARERIAKMAALHGTDTDGLLPLHSHGSQQSLADKLRHMLTATFGAPLSPAREQTLVRSADNKLDKREARDATLETWLRDRAFRQHCILFQQRPFLWHLWDGMTEGFSAFLNYHRLDRAALDKLTYTLLGDWLRTAKAEGNTARLERAEQLQQKIAKIIEGESPYDIFVRWKSLAEQPLGWEPDLDDGVRLNIRPFMTAGVLRDQPKGISWNKDRGTDVPSAPWYDLGPRNGGNLGDRINDHHTSLAEKRAARETS